RFLADTEAGRDGWHDKERRFTGIFFIARTFNESTQALLRSHALAVIVAILFFEELGVPSPIPGDLMMVYAGVRVTQGRDALWMVLLLQEVATVLGSSGTGGSSTSGRRRWRAWRGRFSGAAAGRSCSGASCPACASSRRSRRAC